MIALRRILFAAWFYGTLTVMALLALATLLGPREWTLAWVRTWMRAVQWGARAIMGIRVEFRGLDNLPKGRPALIAGKHQSTLDTISPFLLLGYPGYVLKKELLNIPVYGQLARRSDMIAVDREAHSRALKQMVADSRRILGQGRSIVIFPEGTRQEPRAPPDYKPGVAALYRELGMPCIPMATNSGHHWPAHGLKFNPGIVVFEFLEPIPAGLKRGEFMRQLEDRIEGATARLAAEGF
jgi:1-acyl-sn-glycerol-3-phosphate acyltransferase